MDFMKQLPQSEEMRRHMVDCQLRTNGVNAPWIIAAMLDTPREAFVPGDGTAAYMDRAIPLGDGRMLNPPLAAGLMLSTAEPKADEKVLLIGAATGYLAALLSSKVKTLVAVEESGALAEAFKANLPDVTLVEGPLAEGSAEQGPYDLIIIDGGIEQLPGALVDQLADGGRMVTGLLEGPVSRLSSGVKHGAHLALRPVIDTEVSALPGFRRAKEFMF
jgi:protein-L-isoaspartate(D-aspartate) O-methyltransferase